MLGLEKYPLVDKQVSVARLLREKLDNLSKQRQYVELRKLEILEEHSA